ncbi:hypothetical protein M065_3027 [Bacteroides fragilis str. Korea 419]|nr:hypothetical protein M065_3027 [Bacteroides fragilis str. Korea 419]
MFHITFHGMVHTNQPVCLVGKDGHQRSNYKYGDMFDWEFHAGKDNG